MKITKVTTKINEADQYDAASRWSAPIYDYMVANNKLLYREVSRLLGEYFDNKEFSVDIDHTRDNVYITLRLELMTDIENEEGIRFINYVLSIVVKNRTPLFEIKGSTDQGLLGVNYFDSLADVVEHIIADIPD